MTNECYATDCEQNALSKGLCNKHYRRLLRHGDINFVTTFEQQNCSIDDCSKPSVSRGWCTLHYSRYKLHGDPLFERQRQTHCDVPDCDGKMKSRGLCSFHYYMDKQAIDLESATRVRDNHNGLCAICGSDTPGGLNSSWHTDHDHKTGLARGILCSSCNIGLGHFKDDLDILANAMAYLMQSVDVLEMVNA